VLNLFLYELFQKRLKQYSLKENSYFPLVSGIMAKAISITLLYPLTTIKIRLQENQFVYLKNLKLQKAEEEKYRNIRHVLQALLHNEGLGGFYKGYRINMYR